MSTRGRANMIRAALELRVSGNDPLCSTELDAALSNCLSCKGCTPECPSNVNLSLLKAELMHARYRRDGMPLRERFLSNVDLLGKIGCAMPALANGLLDYRPVRVAMEKTIGLSARRSLPHYADERFDRWFSKHSKASVSDDTVFHRHALQKRGEIILWDDTFVRYHEPQIGIAAVKVLEALGFEVLLLKNRRCCGRPAFSQGKSGHRGETGKRQRGSSLITQCQSDADVQAANSVPRAVVLVDVRGRLSRAKDRERRKDRAALFFIRRICRRLARRRSTSVTFSKIDRFKPSSFGGARQT